MKFIKKLFNSNTGTVDPITFHKNSLANMQEQSESALNLVTSTISQLSTVNEIIDTDISSIENYERDLALTKTELTDTKAKNEKIIENFTKIIEG